MANRTPDRRVDRNDRRKANDRIALGATGYQRLDMICGFILSHRLLEKSIGQRIELDGTCFLFNHGGMCWTSPIYYSEALFDSDNGLGRDWTKATNSNVIIGKFVHASRLAAAQSELGRPDGVGISQRIVKSFGRCILGTVRREVGRIYGLNRC
jgi:hypothetical protein